MCISLDTKTKSKVYDFIFTDIAKLLSPKRSEQFICSLYEGHPFFLTVVNTEYYSLISANLMGGNHISLL